MAHVVAWGSGVQMTGEFAGIVQRGGVCGVDGRVLLRIRRVAVGLGRARLCVGGMISEVMWRVGI